MIKVQLLNGEFDARDAKDLIAELIQLKIRFHEKKIAEAENEEDIKERERKIKKLHQEWSDIQHALRVRVKMHAVIEAEESQPPTNVR